MYGPDYNATKLNIAIFSLELRNPKLNLNLTFGKLNLDQAEDILDMCMKGSFHFDNRNTFPKRES